MHGAFSSFSICSVFSAFYLHFFIIFHNIFNLFKSYNVHGTRWIVTPYLHIYSMEITATFCCCHVPLNHFSPFRVQKKLLALAEAAIIFSSLRGRVCSLGCYANLQICKIMWTVVRVSVWMECLWQRKRSCYSIKSWWRTLLSQLYKLFLQFCYVYAGFEFISLVKCRWQRH